MPQHNRRSIRLKGYDYASEGAYFITACTHQRRHLFGKIVNGYMNLSDAGEILSEVWHETPLVRPNVELGEFVIMPDHIHAIIIIQWRDPEIVEVPFIEHPLKDKNDLSFRLLPRSPSGTVGAIIRGIKGSATAQINRLYESYGAPVWQRNYYEHIIRNEREFDLITRYIRDNPARWPW